MLITKINVRGLIVDVHLVTAKEYAKLDKNSYAFIDWDERKIVYQVDHIDIYTIRHELVHAYLKSCFIDSFDGLQADQLEEIVCETFSYFGMEILKGASSLKTLLEEKRALMVPSKKRGKTGA